MSEKVHEVITDELIDKRIILKGLTVESKAGACLKLKDQVIYIKEWEEWEPELKNKIIKVSGVLRNRKFIPDPVIGKDGGISQGAEGNQLVLENYKVEL